VTAMLVGMSTLAWAWSEFKRRWHPLSAVLRACLAAAAIYMMMA
jgi:hypothetical protein